MTQSRCVICQESFTPKYVGTLACSEPCQIERLRLRQKRRDERRRDAGRHRVKNRARRCLVCRKPFTLSRQFHLVCSAVCQVESRRAYARHYHVRHRDVARRARKKSPARARTERQCKLCGETFPPTHGRQRLCSEPCRQESARRSRRKNELLHHDVILEQRRRYRAAHREKYRARWKHEREANRERRQATKAKCRQRERQRFAAITQGAIDVGLVSPATRKRLNVRKIACAVLKLARIRAPADD